MKNYTYLFMLSGFLLLSSCAKSDDDLKYSTGDDPVCTPYISTSFNASDLLLFPTDETTTIVGHSQEANCLILDTRFTGGCEDHVLQLLIDDNNQSSINATTILPALLSHNNTDQCEAYVAFKVFVDVSKLELLQMESITLSIENYNQNVELFF